MAFGPRRRVGWRKPGPLPIAVLLAAAIVIARPLPRLFALGGQTKAARGPEIGAVVDGEVSLNLPSGKTLIDIGTKKLASLAVPLSISVLERNSKLQKGTKQKVRFEGTSKEGPIVSLVDQDEVLQLWDKQRRPPTDFEPGSTVDAQLCFRSKHLIQFDIGCKEVATLVAPAAVKARLRWDDPFSGLRIDGVDAATGQINVTLPDDLLTTIAARPALKPRLEPRLIPVRGEGKKSVIIAPKEEQYTEYGEDTVNVVLRNLEILGVDATTGSITVSTKRPPAPRDTSEDGQAPKGRTKFRTATDVFSEGDVVDGVIRTINGFGTWVTLDNQSISEHKDFSLQGVSTEVKRKLMLGERLRNFKITLLNETVANVEMSPEEFAKVDQRKPRELRKLSDINAVGDEFHGFVAVIESSGVWVDFGFSKYGKLDGKFKKTVRVGTRLPGVKVTRLDLEKQQVDVEISKPL